MKKFKTLVISASLLLTSAPLAAEELINCVIYDDLGGGDNLSRGFYIDSYPGATLDQVIIFIETSIIGYGNYSLTVRNNTFGGEILGVAQADYGFSMEDFPVPIAFDFGRISVTPGSRITFAAEQVSGDANSYFSKAALTEDCPVIETTSTSPPLGGSDRGIVYAIVNGLSEAPEASLASLENPGDGASVSGIGTFSGWVCDAKTVEVEVDGSTLIETAYGTPRDDTLDVCGDTDNGFGLLFNWALFGDGEHTVTLLADGIEVDSGTFTVTTLGTPFLSGASGDFDLMNFPENGQLVTVEWSQAQQGFVITGFEE